MGKFAEAPSDNHPDNLRRKLALLEGDRKAYFETSQATIKQNQEQIDKLRQDNKRFVAKLKKLKAPSKEKHSAKGGAHLDQKLAELKTQKNTAKHNVIAKQKQLDKLNSQFEDLLKEVSDIEKTQSGESAEAKRLRKIENELEKAQIKCQEAQHIGNTYDIITEKLRKERLGYDGEISEIEKGLKLKEQELVEVESMCTDACLSRDLAQQELAKREKENSEARRARDAEKKQLDALAEDRRRQYEAIEKRLRNAANSNVEEEEAEEESEETRQKITTYEDAMKRIQEATGVSDIQEVVDRFLVQGQTQEHLKKLQKENTETLQRLREESTKVSKQFEALKYSGEARNTSNQRMLSEFEKHLTTAQEKCKANEENAKQTQKIQTDVKAAVDHLHVKLDKLKPVQFRAASNMNDKLTEARLRLVNLVEELESRKSELPDGAEAEIRAILVLPEHNTRIKIDLDEEKEKRDDSDSEDDEFVSRDAMKRTAQSLVDSKNNKKKGRRKKR